MAYTLVEYPSFLEHIRRYAGTRNWCVAARQSRRTAEFDVVITPRQYERERHSWAVNHPAYILANSLPDCDEKRFIMKAVLSRLGTE